MDFIRGIWRFLFAALVIITFPLWVIPLTIGNLVAVVQDLLGLSTKGKR